MVFDDTLLREVKAESGKEEAERNGDKKGMKRSWDCRKGSFAVMRVWGFERTRRGGG